MVRREGKFGLSRTLRHCCAGRCHVNPERPTTGPLVWRHQAAQEQTLQERRSIFKGLRLVARAFGAWKGHAGVSGTDKWSSKGKPWANCCGYSGTDGKAKARTCFGHNYSHIARCSICKHGDPSKPLKKIPGQKKDLWNQILRDVRSYEAGLHSSEITQSKPFARKFGQEAIHARTSLNAGEADKAKWAPVQLDDEFPPLGLESWTLVNIQHRKSSTDSDAGSDASFTHAASMDPMLVAPPPKARWCASGCPCVSGSSRRRPAKRRFALA